MKDLFWDEEEYNRKEYNKPEIKRTRNKNFIGSNKENRLDSDLTRTGRKKSKLTIEKDRLSVNFHVIKLVRKKLIGVSNV